MTLNKEVVVDKIEVVGAYNHVQVRTVTRIMENENVIAVTNHRHVIEPGRDYSNEDERVKDVCKAVHTDNIISSYQEAIKSQD